jgi:hypothetical protein
MTIRLFTGWSNMGGSTVANINLVNLFNKNKIDAELYGPHDWAQGKCKFTKFPLAPGQPPHSNIIDQEFVMDTVQRGDVVLCHALPLAFDGQGRGFLKRAVYTCHETNLYPVSTYIDHKKFDFIHYVSNFQRDWHKLSYPNVVIPNVLNNLTDLKKTLDFKKVGGIIGSIDPHKQTHFSVLTALADGCDKVLIFGAVTSPKYYEDEIRPLVEGDDRVEYCGVLYDKSAMYANIDTVYHSSPRETFNLVEHECRILDKNYIHTSGMLTSAEAWEHDEILMAWKKVLCL